MPVRRLVAILALGASPFVAACGGEAPKKEEAPTPPAKAEGGAPAAAAPVVGAAASGTASISGKVSFEGTVPPAQKVPLSADPKCQAMHPGGLEKRTIEVKDGGLADVLVYVKSGVSGTYPPPSEPAVINQKGCNYTPHVLVLQVGQALTIRNSDETMHNIHFRPTVNPEKNFGQPKPMDSPWKFEKAENWFPVGCDVHPWMRAFVAVLPHPFHAVTAADGTFTIKGLPTGEYEIEAIHEKLKSQTAKITVKGGEAATLNLTYKG